jgi:GntR family transcriptional regulator
VRDLIEKRIISGEWQPGTELPREHELAATLHVSIETIRKAMSELEKDRIVTRIPGRGAFVNPQSSSN